MYYFFGIILKDTKTCIGAEIMPSYVINKYRGLYKRAYELYEEKKYKEALELLEVVVSKDESNYEANYYLAEIYFYGKEVPKNEKRAFACYLYAAEGHLKEAIYMVAVCYFKGIGVYKDYTQAFNYFTEAIKYGVPMAEYYLGYMNKYGLSVEPPDKPRALMWFLKAANNQIPEAQKEAGMCYEELNDYFSAATLYLAGAKNNEPYCMEKIADYYAEGKYVDKAVDIAIAFYNKASALGSKTADVKLAMIYEDSSFINDNEAKAVSLYIAAAKDGNAIAANNLANCYYEGKGIDQDKYFAYTWWCKAANGGSIDAMVSLAKFLSEPPVSQVEKDLITAKFWWMKASEAGNSYAMYRLGRCFERGLGVSDISFKDAYKWYKLSAQNGCKEAQKALKRYKKHLFGGVKIKSFSNENDAE